MITEPVCVVGPGADLGEGPSWDAGAGVLWWVDIRAPAVHRFDPASGEDRAIPVPDVIGAVVPRAKGGLVVALRDGFYALDPATGATEPLCKPEPDKPGNRFNDGKCDRRGRFWAGTMDDAEIAPTGDLYRLDPDLTATRFPAGFPVTNGLGWSPDDATMYFTDSARRTIYAYAFDAANGAIANRRVFARVADDAGFPDGLAVDAEGFVWSCHWDGWRITRYDPTGRVARVIAMPVPRASSCAFGGAGLDTLYVTSARHGLDAASLAEAPLSGALFALDPGARGLPESPFAG